MKIIHLKKGDLVVKTLEEKLVGAGVSSGFLWGLGAVSKAELMLYDLERKKYSSRKLTGAFEVVSLSAVISKEMEGKKVMIHPHIVLSDKTFHCFGGHLKEAVVAATLEVAVFKSKDMVTRYFDKNIGLNLLK